MRSPAKVTISSNSTVLASVQSALLCLFLMASTGALAEGPYATADTPNETALALPEPIAPPVAPLNLGTEPVSKRLFGVIPDYHAAQYQANDKPITTRQKFAIARSDSFDWPNYFLLAGYALQSQVAAGGFSHNGGLNGFGRYYSRGVADQIIGCYVTEAILPSLLHEDPRFFRLGVGPIWYRAYNAASRIFVAKKDDGHTGFYFSEVAGNAGVVALTTVYYPDSQSASEAFERYSMVLGNDMMSNLLTEFWPDIKRRLRLLHHQ